MTQGGTAQDAVVIAGVGFTVLGLLRLLWVSSRDGDQPGSEHLALTQAALAAHEQLWQHTTPLVTSSRSPQTNKLITSQVPAKDAVPPGAQGWRKRGRTDLQQSLLWKETLSRGHWVMFTERSLI